MSLDRELWKLRFSDHLRLRGRARMTVASYTRQLDPLFLFLEALGVASLGEVTRDHLEEYRTHLFYRTYRGKPLSAKTQNCVLCAVRAFFRFLVHCDYLLVDPSAKLELPRTGDRLPLPLLSEREMVLLLETPDTGTPLGLRDRAILELLYSTGLRNGEVCALELGDVDPEQGVVRVQTAKGGRSRIAPLGELAAEWLAAYLEHSRPKLKTANSGSWLFLSRRGRQLDTCSLGEMVSRTAAAAPTLHKRVTAHLIRHCCATHMLKNGAGLRHLQTLLGHRSLETTQRYTRLEIEDLRSVHRRCHPREHRS